MVMQSMVSGRLVRLLAGMVTLGLSGALFIGGAQPQAVDLVPAPWDKLAHAVVYAMLTMSCGLLIPAPRTLLPWLGLAAALALGLLDEWHQSGLPGRHAGLDDLLADAAGALAGAWVLWRLNPLQGRKSTDTHD